jgi:Kinesin motor domain
MVGADGHRFVRWLQATAMNAASSRSHSVLTLHIKGRHDSSGECLTGALNLVDLAGRYVTQCRRSTHQMVTSNWTHPCAVKSLH